MQNVGNTRNEAAYPLSSIQSMLASVRIAVALQAGSLTGL
jgi:hypothetical protein